MQGDGFAPSAENLQASRANLGKAWPLVPHYLDNTASAERRDPPPGACGPEMHEGPCHPGHAATSSPRPRPRWTTPAGSTRPCALALQDSPHPGQLASVLGRLGLLLSGNPLQAQLGDLNAAGQALRQARGAVWPAVRAQASATSNGPTSTRLGPANCRSAWGWLANERWTALRAANEALRLRDAVLRAGAQNPQFRYQHAWCARQRRASMPTPATRWKARACWTKRLAGLEAEIKIDPPTKPRDATSYCSHRPRPHALAG